MHSAPRRWAPLVLAIVSAAALPTARAAAQDIRDLERRIDAEVAMRNVAAARLAEVRRQPVVQRAFTDTVPMLDGAFLVITDRDLVPLVRAATARAETFIRRRTARPDRLRGTVLAVWTDSIRRLQHGLISSLRVNGQPGSEQYILDDAASLAWAIDTRAQSALATGGGLAIGNWLGGMLPVDTSTNDNWRAVRLELVSSRANVARRCYAGDLAACKVTLGLADAVDPVITWYDSVDRRAAVAAGNKFGGLDRALATSCLGGRDGDCITLLRTSQSLQSWSSAPGSARARMTFVQQAFAMGGQGSLDRLAAAGPDSTATAIGALANAPIDSVVAQWQRHAHDGGIESAIATPVIVMASLGWVLAIGAVSLRSPRWR